MREYQFFENYTRYSADRYLRVLCGCADLIKVQMVVFKKHLSRTIMHNDIIAMETLKADFGAFPLYPDRITDMMTCIPLYSVQVRPDGHFCAMHAVTDTLRSVCLSSLY